MRKLLLLSLALVLLVACNQQRVPQQESGRQHTIIDWVDFVKIDGVQYEAIYSGVLADPEHIGEVVGEVTYKVSGNITNPYYNIQDGDSAFWEAGTKVYAIKGTLGFVAVEDYQEINGFQIYVSDGVANEYEWHYLDIDKTAINKVEIYEGYNNPHLTNTLTDKHEIAEFIKVLDRGESKPLFTPNTSQGDPKIFDMIFYHDHVFAYKYTMLFDGNNWYWHPWETSVVSHEIERFMGNVHH